MPARLIVTEVFISRVVNLPIFLAFIGDRLSGFDVLAVINSFGQFLSNVVNLVVFLAFIGDSPVAEVCIYIVVNLSEVRLFSFFYGW